MHMAQVRRPLRYRSPPPRQIPLLPNPIRFQPPIPHNDRSFPRTIPPPFQDNISHNKQYDPVSGLMINANNSEQSLTSLTSSSVQIGNLEKQPQQSSETTFPTQNITITDESVIIPMLNDDNDDGFFNKKHLPVFAQLPFNTSFLLQPMETNVEDNIHKLRLRLIDSELNHQRRSTDEYIKRTQKEVSLSSPTSTVYYTENVRPPSELVHQQVIPKILSRQTSLSILSVATSSSSGGLSGDRIGIENELSSNSDLERELEIRRIQESLDKRRRSNQQLSISNYSYDPRVHLQPLNEERAYTSSNMDDLIDSMARRHLAYRRLDAAIDRQRHSNGFHGPYTESLNTGRISHRNDDLLNTNRTPRNQAEYNLNQMVRSRIDYYNRIQPDSDSMGINDMIRRNSYTRLPPISHGYDSNNFQTSSISTFYEPKHDSHNHRKHRQTIPLNLSDQSEHLIELPSDIYLTTRRVEPGNSSRKNHKTRSRSISKDGGSRARQSDIENELSSINQHEKNLQNGDDGFFTEPNVKQKKKTKYRRNLFKKISIGILFLITLKHRSIKNRPNRSNQSPSATIHKIRLQEIIVALHRVYLEPDGPIYNALIQAITSTIPLQDGLNRSSKNYSEAIKIIGNAVKNIILKIVEFMPKDGVLGTAKNSAVCALIQDGNSFPENYFWQCEREHLQFKNLKVINITKQRAILLIIGIFIFRALVTTLLIKPIKYRLVLGQLTTNQSANLKILASVILYIGRRTAGSKSRILTLPHEWQLSLYSDADIEPILQNSEIKSIISTCEQSLYTWCEEYIRRIDANFGKELRI